MSKRFRLIFALACAVLSMMLCALFADHVRGEAERVRSEAIARYGGEVVTLMVANENLEPGDVITQANVTMRDWLADLAPEGALMSLDETLGEEISVPAAKGAPLTKLNFRADETLAEVPAGHVALTLPITDKLGIPRTLGQGATLEAYQVSRDSTSLIATGMQVLSRPSANASLSGAQITLAVPPESVSAVLAASASGDLRLVIPASDVAEKEKPAPEPNPSDTAEDSEQNAATPVQTPQDAHAGNTSTGLNGTSPSADTDPHAGATQEVRPAPSTETPSGAEPAPHHSSNPATDAASILVARPTPNVVSILGARPAVNPLLHAAFIFRTKQSSKNQAGESYE